MKYHIFEQLLKDKNISFEKEVLLKDLMPKPEFFKHKFRCDYVIKHTNKFHKLIIEIEGGTFTQGRHNNSVGSWNDILKYNAVIFAGFPIIKFTAIMIKDNPVQVVDLIDKYVNHTLTTEDINNFTKNFKIKPKKRKP